VTFVHPLDLDQNQISFQEMSGTIPDWIENKEADLE
jgi:hypothetical protein